MATWGSNVRTAVQALRTMLLDGGLLGKGGRLEQSYVVPTTPEPGIPLSALSASSRNSIVQTDGTVLRAVKMTQAEYDAQAATAPATTVFFIVG
jgi:hypothetical protein